MEQSMGQSMEQSIDRRNANRLSANILKTIANSTNPVGVTLDVRGGLVRMF
jgi:hypothetical protein